MNKKTFLDELSKGLSKLPNKERKVLIDFYSELIDDKIENGQSEVDVIASFGSVNVLVERLLIENPNRKKSGCLYWIIGFIGVLVIVYLILFLNFSSTTTNIKDDTQITMPADESNVNSTSNQGEFTVVSYDYNDIDEVSLEVDISEIIIEKAKDENINIRYIQYDDEINKVELKGRKLEFDNELKTNKTNKNSERIIYVEIPEDFNGYLEAGADLGAIKMAGFSLRKIDLSADMGTVEISDCKADDIDLSSDMGSLIIKNTIAERNFEASSDMGTVEFTNIDGQLIELTTDMGSIKGNLLGKEDDYSIVTEVGMGKSNIKNRTGGNKRLDVEAGMGSIEISFEK